MKKNSNTATKGTPIKLDGINHFALNVRNMDRALEFYTGVLGFPAIMRSETRAGLKHVEVDAGNVAIALFESPDLDLTAAQKTMTDDGYLHFAFAAPYERYDATLQALKENGSANGRRTARLGRRCFNLLSRSRRTSDRNPFR